MAQRDKFYGDVVVLGSISGSSITGSLLGTAATASYVNPLTQSVSIKGTGATSATTALSIQNSSAATSMVVLDNGNIGFGTTIPNSKLSIIASTTGDGGTNLGNNSVVYIK